MASEAGCIAEDGKLADPASVEIEPEAGHIAAVEHEEHIPEAVKIPAVEQIPEKAEYMPEDAAAAEQSPAVAAAFD
ncbi:MAG: hypothetical protein N2489_04395 [Clostridia bacterium]|nr:hypothetical protein [Clostridia bacterium]